ncbi:MAG: hypothetical protein ACK55Z_21295, partial [bacterium]
VLSITLLSSLVLMTILKDLSMNTIPMFAHAPMMLTIYLRCLAIPMLTSRLFLVTAQKLQVMQLPLLEILI